MQSPYTLDGQDDLRMDLELAEAMGHCSTDAAGEEVDEMFPAGQPEIARPRPSSAGSDGNIKADAAGSKADAQQPARPHSTPPTCTGIVADMIDNIFRNVLVSIETNDVAMGLDRLCVGGAGGAGNVHSAHKLQMRPGAAVRKTRHASAAFRKNVPTRQQPPRAPDRSPELPKTRGVADTVRELRPPVVFAPLAIRPPSCDMSQSSASDRESVCSP